MPNDVRYTAELERAFDLASQLHQSDNPQQAIAEFSARSSLQTKIKAYLAASATNEPIALDKTVAQAIQTIINNFNSNKYLYSILITCLVKKIVAPDQDIRYAQENMPGGYSNRSLDQVYVTPFLKRHGLTSMAASGLESGRNMERPIPWNLQYSAKPRGAGNLEAFIGILHYIQEEQGNAFDCLVLLMALDLANKSVLEVVYPELKGLTIQEVIDMLEEFFTEAQGNGKSRLPVLAIHAVYQSIVPQVARYKGTTLLPVNRHTANDKKGWVGDVQINSDTDRPFEAVEVKSEKSIEPFMIMALPRKIQGYNVNRYYILSTKEKYIQPGFEQEIADLVRDVRVKTGCEVIVNGLMRTLWYYLRLIEDKDQFVKDFTSHIMSDLDVQKEHQQLWATISEKFISSNNL